LKKPAKKIGLYQVSLVPLPTKNIGFHYFAHNKVRSSPRRGRQAEALSHEDLPIGTPHMGMNEKIRKAALPCPLGGQGTPLGPQRKKPNAGLAGSQAVVAMG